MIDFIQSYIMGIITHYKKMTMIVFIAAMIKLACSLIFPALTWYDNWSSRRQRIKLLMDFGLSREDAETRVKEDDERIKRIQKENSFWNSFRKILKKIWRK